MGPRRSGPDRPRQSQRSSEGDSSPPERQFGPRLPDNVEAKQLSPEVRRELTTLDKATADYVAKHLVVAGDLLDEDPEAALEHARAARGRASRIAGVREAVGIAAYHCGDWAQALSELRAARRMGSKSPLLPLIAETGGQNAMIVDASAQPEQVVLDVLVSGFDSAGQRCSALRVLCLQEDIADRVLALDVILEAQAGPWLATCNDAIAAAERAFDSVRPKTLRLHGDCHPGNVLWRDGGPHLVDLDDACTGPAVQDLWMLLSGQPEAMRTQLDAVLAGYQAFRPFDRKELALIEPLRTLRMIHHSAWLAERWSDPAFPAAFPWFGTPNYWSQQTSQLREQLEAMAEPPAW